MKKFSLFMLLLLMVGFFVAVPVFAAGNEYSASPMKSGEFQAFHVNDLVGKTVKNSAGDELGKVEDMVIGKNGRADFVILSRGGTLGVGAKYIPIPFQTFMSSSTNLARVNTDADLIANLDKAKLDSAPAFTDNTYGLSTTDSHKQICSYYGAGACPSS